MRRRHTLAASLWAVTALFTIGAILCVWGPRSAPGVPEPPPTAFVVFRGPRPPREFEVACSNDPIHWDGHQRCVAIGVRTVPTPAPAPNGTQKTP